MPPGGSQHFQRKLCFSLTVIKTYYCTVIAQKQNTNIDYEPEFERGTTDHEVDSHSFNPFTATLILGLDIINNVDG